MDFSRQLRRAEQLAKSGSLVMPPDSVNGIVMPTPARGPSPLAPWCTFNGGLPMETPFFQGWFNDTFTQPPIPKLTEVWVDMDVNYLDVDAIGRDARRAPQPSDRVMIEFTGTPAPAAYVSAATAEQLREAEQNPKPRPAPRVPDVYIPDGIAILSALLCGCSDQVDVWQSVLDELKRLNTPFEEKTKEQYVPKPGQWFLANMLDKAGLTEHGGNLCAAWLTYDGERTLEFLEDNGVMWWDTLDAEDVAEAGMRYQWDYDRREQ